MNLKTLQEKIMQNDVPERWYSIDNGLKPDACIIYKNYSTWECFYLDERGNRDFYTICTSDEDAYDWLWSKIEGLLKFRKKVRKD